MVVISQLSECNWAMTVVGPHSERKRQSRGRFRKCGGLSSLHVALIHVIVSLLISPEFMPISDVRTSPKLSLCS